MHVTEAPTQIITLYQSVTQGQRIPLTPPLNFAADGVEKRGTFFCVAHISVRSALKGDYIIAIVASEPSAFPHWPIYSGLSAPDKDGAFRQFSGQETQALEVTPHYSQTHQSTQSAAGKTMDDTRSLDFWQRNRVTPVWTYRPCWNRPSLAFPLVLFRLSSHRRSRPTMNVWLISGSVAAWANMKKVALRLALVMLVLQMIHYDLARSVWCVGRSVIRQPESVGRSRQRQVRWWSTFPRGEIRKSTKLPNLKPQSAWNNN